MVAGHVEYGLSLSVNDVERTAFPADGASVCVKRSYVVVFAGDNGLSLQTEHPVLVRIGILYLKFVLAETNRELGDNGRLLLRKSGTEPLIRVMVEAKDEATCHRYVDEVAALVKNKAGLA